MNIARETKALRIELDALVTLGTVAVWMDEDGGVAVLREAIARASAHDLVDPAMRGRYNLVSSIAATGSTGMEVRRLRQEMFTYAALHGYRNEVVITEEASCALAEGDWDAALTLGQEARGESFLTAALQMLEAFIQAGREGPERAVPLIDASRRLLRGASTAHRLLLSSSLARIEFLAGNARAALDDVEAIAGDLWRLLRPCFDDAALCALGATVALDDVWSRGRWIELVLADETGPRRVLGRATRAYAQAERAAGEEKLDSAIVLLGESAELCVAALTSFGETLTRRRRAELLLRRNAPGDREAAQTELVAILLYWRKAKATWYLGQLQRWATELGLDFPEEGTAATPSPTRAARTQLTAREREVAALVATGLSNKGIATKLVISERTAEGHVERILGKLEFRSRSQIASWHAGGDPPRASS